MDSDGDASAEDLRFMQAALALGRRGLGLTAPNPSVAALLVRDGVVISRAVTAPSGRPHAETQALLVAGERARGATLYVTLEPCSHHGQTRPCADAILEAGVARVVVAIGDPDPRVSGRGIERLRRAGIEVSVGVGAQQAHRDHLGHIRRVQQARPMLTLKLAETADGFAATDGPERLMITGPAANAWVHGARAQHDGVLVGIGTVLADDPSLTVRLPGMAGRHPARIVVDGDARLPLTSRLVASAADGPVLVLARPDADPHRVAALLETGVTVLAVQGTAAGGVDLTTALRTLAGHGLTRVFCEGGPTLAAALLDRDLVEECVLLTGPDRLSRPGRLALEAAARTRLAEDFTMREDRPMGADRLRIFERNEACSPA